MTAQALKADNEGDLTEEGFIESFRSENNRHKAKKCELVKRFARTLESKGEIPIDQICQYIIGIAEKEDLASATTIRDCLDQKYKNAIKSAEAKSRGRNGSGATKQKTTTQAQTTVQQTSEGVKNEGRAEVYDYPQTKEIGPATTPEGIRVNDPIRVWQEMNTALRKENTELRKENDDLKKRNAALEKENASLKKQLEDKPKKAKKDKLAMGNAAEKMKIMGKMMGHLAEDVKQ